MSWIWIMWFLPSGNVKVRSCRWNGKQCRPWSDCSFMRNLIWVNTVFQDLSEKITVSTHSSITICHSSITICHSSIATVIPLSLSVIPLLPSVIPLSPSVIPLSLSVIPLSPSVIPLSPSVIPLSLFVIPLSLCVIPLSPSVCTFSVAFQLVYKCSVANEDMKKKRFISW